MIKLSYNGGMVFTESFTFSGGEIQVKVPTSYQVGNEIYVWVNLRNANDIMELLMVNSVLEYKTPSNIRKVLVMPYVPYARQDRIMVDGEALSIKVFANLINGMNFDKVIVHDAHSEVAVALIDRCVNVPKQDLIVGGQAVNTWASLLSQYLWGKKYILVSPDAGAEKKTIEFSKAYGGLPIVFATKVRDVNTGRITDTKVINPEIIKNHPQLLILDDICDGGFTFIKLAEELHKYEPKAIDLFVTHGIFSKGYKPLFEGGIRTIYTTNSFEQTHEVQRLKVI